MEPEGLLLRSQEPATGLKSPTDIPKPYFPKIHFNIIVPSTTRSSEWSLPCSKCSLFKYSETCVKRSRD
jgi:hypothetical protein